MSCVIAVVPRSPHTKDMASAYAVCSVMAFPPTTPESEPCFEYKSCSLEVFQNKRKIFESALSQSDGARRFTGQNFRELDKGVGNNSARADTSDDWPYGQNIMKQRKRSPTS